MPAAISIARVRRPLATRKLGGTLIELPITTGPHYALSPIWRPSEAAVEAWLDGRGGRHAA